MIFCDDVVGMEIMFASDVLVLIEYALSWRADQSSSEDEDEDKEEEVAEDKKRIMETMISKTFGNVSTVGRRYFCKDYIQTKISETLRNAQKYSINKEKEAGTGSF